MRDGRRCEEVEDAGNKEQTFEGDGDPSGNAKAKLQRWCVPVPNTRVLRGVLACMKGHETAP